MITAGGIRLVNCPPSSEELAIAWRPYIETHVAAFGAERAIFESNFPIDNGSCSYAAP